MVAAVAVRETILGRTGMADPAVRVTPLALVTVIVKTVKITGVLPVICVAVAAAAIMELFDVEPLGIATINLAVAVSP